MTIEIIKANAFGCKKESVVLLACILFIIVIGIIYIAYLIINKLIYGKKELFSNDSKRDKMIKIFKSDDSRDPNDTYYTNTSANINKQSQMHSGVYSDTDYTDDCNDPDGNCGYDPE